MTLQTNKPFRPADCRERFWLHRYLAAHGITNYIVDSSSIEVQLSGLIARATTSRATQRVTQRERWISSSFRRPRSS